MDAPQAAAEPLVRLESLAPVGRFHRHEDAIRAIADYETSIRESALRRRTAGLTVADQNFPEVAFCLVPKFPAMPPLAIVGGMGPLAGAMAFRQACTRWQDSRTVVLYQACSMPDRSTLILREGGPDSSACHQMASLLADAVRHAASLISTTGQQVRCVIACNSAHYFWQGLYGSLGSGLQMISLVEASVAATRALHCRNVLLLETEGARVGRIFSEPFRKAGISFEEPPPPLDRLLMRTIYEGVKSLDDRRTVECGNEFFEGILRTRRDYDCILAGCTEVPAAVELLKRCGSPSVAAFLTGVTLVDPLQEALARA